MELAVTAHEADGGIIITASHNPRQWNALKLLDADGEFLSDAEGKRVLELAERSDFEFPEVDALGHVLSRESFNDEHIRRVLALPLVDVDAVRRKRFKVVVDAVNSVGGIVIPKLLRELGCEVVELNCEPTGEFAHNPEPLPENLTEIAAAVVREKADLGVVVDPDVDRLAFVSEDGSMFVEEYTLVAVADYVLSHRKGRYGLEPQFVAGAARCDRASWRPLSRFGRGRSQRRGEDEGGRRRHRRRRQRRRDLSRTALRPRRAGGRGAVLTYLAQTGLRMTALRATYPAYYASKNKIALTPAIDVDKVLREIKDRYAGEQVNDIDGVKIDFCGELGTPAQVQYRADHPRLYRGTVDGRSRCAGAAVHRRTARNLQPVKRHTIMEKVLDYIRSHRDAFVEELFEVLRIPSISAQTEHRGDMVRCAEHLAAALVKAGADHAEVMPTEGNPVVFAEKIVDPKAKTVLVYGHYDVMPVDPREEWTTEPFEPSCATAASGGAEPTTTRGSRSCTSRRSRRCARPDNCPAT